jgi:hypothetical protein
MLYTHKKPPGRIFPHFRRSRRQTKYKVTVSKPIQLKCVGDTGAELNTFPSHQMRVSGFTFPSTLILPERADISQKRHEPQHLSEWLVVRRMTKL